MLCIIIPPRVAGFFYVHIWQVNFSGSISVAGNQSYPISPFWEYIGNTSWQTCEQLSFEMTLNNDTVQPIDLGTDLDENPQVRLNISTQLVEGDILTWEEQWQFTVANQRPPLPQISIEQSGSTFEIPDHLTPENYQLYTQNTPLWKVNNQTLLNLANTIREDLPEEYQTNTLSLIYAAIGWIKSNIERAAQATEPQYPEELLVSQVGDCDDQSNLLITILRIYGIPSYLMTGHWYQEGTSTSGFLWGSVLQDAYMYINWKNVNGHGWAMVFVPPWGWLPFDLTVEESETSPEKTYTDSLYARAVPMVTLWQIITTDYIGDRRAEEAATIDYRLHRLDYEEWVTLGNIPILDLPYFATNLATLVALIVTFSILGVLVGIGMRKQPTEETLVEQSN
jgi:hypothetical protein